MTPEEAAALEVVRRDLKRSAGLIRTATAAVASIADTATVLGSVTVHDAEGVQEATDRIAHGVAQHGGVQVVVIARPGR